ncbi:hypothetical protein D3C71_532250 [compost metagenome]
MNLIQSLFVKGAQEAGELVAVFAQLAAMGPKAMDQSAPSPAVSTEDGEEDPTGQPLVLKAIKEINEILAAVELLRDRGIPLAGIGDPVAVGEAKNMIIKCMEAAMQGGQLVLNDEDKNPRPEGVNEASNGIPEGQGDEGGNSDGNSGYDDNSSDNAAAGDEAGDTSADDDSGDAGDGSGDGSDDQSGGDGGDGGDSTDTEEEEEDDSDDSSDNDTDSDDDDSVDGSDEEDEPGSNDV